MTRDVDVVVAGAGPAGSEFAYRMARRGYRVLVFERDALDREKPCGGGIQTQEILEFGALPNDVVERPIGSARIVAPDGGVMELPACGATVKRSVYDRWLSRRAEEAGATVTPDAAVVAADPGPCGVTVHARTAAGHVAVRCRLFAVASGATARDLMHSLGLPPFKARSYAVTCQYWIELGREIVDERIGNVIELYNGKAVVPKGYAWIFPKRDVVTVGIGCDATVLADDGINLRQRLVDFAEHHPLASKKLAGGRIVRRDGGPIPFFVAPRLSAPCTLLLGDAGGFGNPIHGGGIYQGRKSAAIAEPFASRFLDTGSPDELEDYAHTARAHFNDYEGRWDVKMRPFFWEDDLLNVMVKRSSENDTAITQAMGIILNGGPSHRVAYEMLEPRMLDLVHDCLRARTKVERTRVNRALAPLFQSPSQLDKVAREALFGDAKRVRASLALMGVDAAGGDAEAAVPMAVAFELLHTASLIHDDIMDESDTRRGRPCVHRTHGVDMAITVGDALIFEAYRQLGLLSRSFGAAQVDEVYRIFSACALRTCRGQALDLRFPFETGTILQYLKMVHRKTGSMIVAPLEGGAALAGAGQATRLAFQRYGGCLGVAFQIVDDAIDYLGTEERAGKTIANDLRRKAASAILIHTRQQSSDADRAEMMRAIQHYAKTGAVAALAPVYRLFHKHDAVAFTQQLVQRYVDRARCALRPVPNSPGARELEAMADIVGYWGLLSAELPQEPATSTPAHSGQR
jgi:geranylgeranyl reductase family protein